MIRAAARMLIVLVMAMAPGCYLSHERGGADDGEGGRRDGGAPDGSTGDADAVGRFDGDRNRDGSPGPDGSGSRADAGPVLPPEPDPDLGPDARPSDYPEADGWDDLPPASDTDPCCTMDDPILIASRDTGMVFAHEPVIAWGPDRWGLLATRTMIEPRFEYDPHPVVFELSRDGHPLGPPHVLEQPSAEPGDPGVLHWAEGRWAVGVTSGVPMDGSGAMRSWAARLYDRDFHPASDWLPVVDGTVQLFDLARMTHGDRWLAIGHDRTTLNVAAFSDLGVDAVVEHSIVAGQTLDALGLRSRAAVLIGGFTGLPAGNVLTVLGAGPTFDVLGSVPLTGRAAAVASLAAVRDVVVAAIALDRAVTVEVVDPFAITASGGPRTLGSLSVEATEGSTAVGAAGSNKLGLVGVCYGEELAVPPPGDRMGEVAIDFRLVGADGALRGAAVRPIEGAFRGGSANCAVGTDDDGFLVAWWTGSELWVRRIHVRR